MSVSLACREYGRGPPLIILHGLFGSKQNWHGIAERLGARYRVLACDLRNHGDSPWTASMRFDEMAGDLETLLDEKGLDSTIVLGHSVGGKTAMRMALSHPDRIEALIVVDIAPVTYQAPFIAYLDGMAAADLSPGRRRAAIEADLAATIPDTQTRQFLLQNLIPRGGGFAWRINLETIRHTLDALLGFPDASTLAYEGRALFVSGAESDYIGRHTHAAIYELFPQAEFAVIAESGHDPHVEQPDRLLACIDAFLESSYA